MTRTQKPCPGCGEVDRYRKANKVCSDCRNQLDGYDSMHRLISSTADAQLYVYSSTYHWNRNFYGKFRLPAFSDVRRDLDRAFHDLVGCVSGPVAPNEHCRDYLLRQGAKAPGSDSNVYGNGPDDLVRLTPETRVAFRRLFELIIEALEAVSIDAYEHGQDFLEQLAKGEVSLADYAERQ